MSLKASCFAVKQQFYGHFLATRIFHLATEKKTSVATWRSHKKVNFGPCLLEDLEGLSVQEKLDIIERNQKALIRLFSEVVKVLEGVENKLCGREDGRLF